MENELPKTEAVVVEEKAGAAGADTAKKVFLAKVDWVKDSVSKMSRTTKSFVLVLTLFALILGGLYYYRGVFVAATVNGSPISRLSVIQELEKKAGKNVLDTLITKKLIADAVKKAGIVVKNEEVDAEIQKIEAQVTAQGGTLETALAGQGMTTADLREQVLINKEIEKILADKIAVTDDEINQYLITNKSLVPKGKSSDDMKDQVREQLKGQKFNTEAGKWISDLKAGAQIDYLIQY